MTETDHPEQTLEDRLDLLHLKADGLDDNLDHVRSMVSAESQALERQVKQLDLRLSRLDKRVEQLDTKADTTIGLLRADVPAGCADS